MIELITLSERYRLVIVINLVEGLVEHCISQFPEARVIRHIERCCTLKAHMSEDDPWVINNRRMEVERDILRK